MDDELTHKYAANISQLAAKARSVIRDLDPQVRKRTATGDGSARLRFDQSASPLPSDGSRSDGDDIRIDLGDTLAICVRGNPSEFVCVCVRCIGCGSLLCLCVQNDLTFLRIRSKKHEIMVAPDKDFLLVVIQDPSISNKGK